MQIIKKTPYGVFLYGVINVTILEPMVPDKNTCLTAGMSVYAELISIMHAPPREYYNMRIALGLECA